MVPSEKGDFSISGCHLADLGALGISDDSIDFAVSNCALNR